MGLVLRLADNVRGAAGLTDLSDGYVDYPTAGYEVGHLVRCFILKYNEEEKRADVSLRNSRYCLYILLNVCLISGGFFNSIPKI